VPVERQVIPTWLAIDWWWILLGTVVESAVRAGIRHRLHQPYPSDAGTWFLAAWGLLQAGWLRSADSRSIAFYAYLISAVLDGVAGILSIGALASSHRFDAAGVVALGSIIAALVGIYFFWTELERYCFETEGVDLEMRWWMVLLFSDFYFQYQFHQMADLQAFNDRVMRERT
jgi:hypothetical protein